MDRREPDTIPGAPETNTQVIFLLGQLSAKLDDVHQMCHKIDENQTAALTKLETRMESKNSEQDVKLDSLMGWRSRVRGVLGFLIALPAVGFVIKKLGFALGGLI